MYNKYLITFDKYIKRSVKCVIVRSIKLSMCFFFLQTRTSRKCFISYQIYFTCRRRKLLQPRVSIFSSSAQHSQLNSRKILRLNDTLEVKAVDRRFFRYNRDKLGHDSPRSLRDESHAPTLHRQYIHTHTLSCIKIIVVHEFVFFFLPPPLFGASLKTLMREIRIVCIERNAPSTQRHAYTFTCTHLHVHIYIYTYIYTFTDYQ